jgi:[ribosomal protein S5]-alanine N-acetyltransferase
VTPRFTERLRLEPVSIAHAGDLFVLHNDPNVARWYDRPWTEADAEERARYYADGWARDGASKWMAYDRSSGALVGRGGVSRAYVDGADRYEVGWAVRNHLQGRGYATEIGRAGLAFAFDELGADEVVAFTEPNNRRSRAVMERLQLEYARDITHDDAPFVLYTMTRTQYRG